MNELAKAHAEIERLNRIVNSGDTLRDHAIRKAMHERDDALTRLAASEDRLSVALAANHDLRDERDSLKDRLVEAEALLRYVCSLHPDDCGCSGCKFAFRTPDSASGPRCERCGDSGWIQGDPVAGIANEPCGCTDADQPEAAGK